MFPDGMIWTYVVFAAKSFWKWGGAGGNIDETGLAVG